MVNRLTQFWKSTGDSPVTRNRGGLAVEYRSSEPKRWLEFLERQICQRPKLCLGLALGLGIGLALVIKRK